MRQRTCDGCAAAVPEKDGYLYGSRFLCGACTETLAQEAAKEHKRVQVSRPLDPTLCARCGNDNGSVEHAMVGDIPLCPGCTANALAFPFPGWLKLSAVVLLMLLVGGLVRGYPLLGPGLALVRAERFVGAKEYRQASDQLATVLTASPDCFKAILLKIKADLLSDRFDTVADLTERIRGHKFQGPLIVEVNGLLARADKALAEFSKAAELMAKNNAKEALPHLEKAEQGFRESKLMHNTFVGARAAVHFEAKDYEGFLADSEELARAMPEDPVATAQVASALAARFAVTGEAALATRAEAQIEKARALCHDQQSRDTLAEYVERIEHRLRTREVIEKEEYNRRFRAGEGAKK